MAIATIAAFIEALQNLPILEPDQRSQLAALAQQLPELKAFAQAVVRRGWLTVVREPQCPSATATRCRQPWLSSPAMIRMETLRKGRSFSDHRPCIRVPSIPLHSYVEMEDARKIDAA